MTNMASGFIEFVGAGLDARARLRINGWIMMIDSFEIEKLALALEAFEAEKEDPLNAGRIFTEMGKAAYKAMLYFTIMDIGIY